jgi:hypothetical protein
MICDACGVESDDRHIRERIERLELATRFRPIHIQALVIDSAPPARIEDYFYRATKDRSVRSNGSRQYFDALVSLNGAINDSESDEGVSLAEFQHRGMFLTYAVECPIADEGQLGVALRRFGPTLLKRVQISYRPKVVALLGPESQELIPGFQAAGWSDRVILDEGRPFVCPEQGDAADASRFASKFNESIRQVLARAS